MELLFMAATAVFEYTQGRTVFGPQEKFQFWCPGTNDNCTSQSLFDPYSLTHVEHGLYFWSLGIPSLWSFGVESAWEAVENSKWGVDNYRSKGYPGYRGDSILNSMSDIACMGAGWFLGQYLGNGLQACLLALAFDGFLELKYKDSLIRNILSLLGFFQ